MFILCIDVGGTEIKHAVMDSDARIGEHGRTPTPREGYEAFLDVVESVYRRYADSVAGMTLCLPGVINADDGYCVSGGSLHYNIAKPLRDDLSRRCKTQVAIENDGRCAVMAEYWRGALRGCNCGVALLLGTAVAGGIIVNGHALTGSHFSAGEFSYLCADASLWDSKRALVGRCCSAVELVNEISAALPEKNVKNGYDAFREIRAGEPRALEAYELFLRSLSVQIYNLQIMLDPDVIAVGGGISREKKLIEDLRRRVEEFFEEGLISKKSHFLPRPKIEACAYHNDANLIGALYNYLRRSGEEKAL